MTKIFCSSKPWLAFLLTLGLVSCGDQMVVEGIDVKTGEPLSGEAAEVEDFGAGESNEGEPDMEADLYEAAMDDEQNLGPNAPGYIP